MNLMWNCVINPFSCWGSDYRRKRNVELILLANDCSMTTGSMSSFFGSPEYDQKAMCLICRESVAEIKRYNVKRHYDSQFDQENELTWDNFVSICKIRRLQPQRERKEHLFNGMTLIGMMRRIKTVLNFP